MKDQFVNYAFQIKFMNIQSEIKAQYNIQWLNLIACDTMSIC